MAYKRRAGSFAHLDYHRITEWRAMQCDAQITLKDIVHRLANYQAFPPDLEYDQYQKIQKLYDSHIRRDIHKVAGELGITRYYVNQKGHKYLMFNIGEAEAVYSALQGKQWPIAMPKPLSYHEWQLTDGYWDLVEIPGRRPKIPENQLRLGL